MVDFVWWLGVVECGKGDLWVVGDFVFIYIYIVGVFLGYFNVFYLLF